MMAWSTLWLWGPWCWACCSGAPEWPDRGEANAQWVRQAIEWRMKVGLDDCQEVVPALDAWTLEWLSESDRIYVSIQSSDWPFLAYAPELQSVLVQRLALDVLSFQTSTQVQIVADVRRVARRSGDMWDDALGRAFDNAEGLAKSRDRRAP